MEIVDKSGVLLPPRWGYDITDELFPESFILSRLS